MTGSTIGSNVDPWTWACHTAQTIYDRVARSAAGEVYILPCDDIIDLNVGPGDDPLWVRIGRDINGECPFYHGGHVLSNTPADTQARIQIDNWINAHARADDERTAYEEEIRAKQREHMLKRLTSHDVIRIGNLVGCRDKYAIRQDAILPWGYHDRFDPVYACKAAVALLVPVYPWYV